MTRNDRNWRKRSHDASEGDSSLSVGQTLAYLNGQQKITAENGESRRSSTASQGGQDASEEWHTVEHRSKKRKKVPKQGSDNYPSIAHTASARLQSYVKLSDLQNLVLYSLADGTGPQCCAVRNHGNVRKVVVLMVPGLEAGMFDGSIPLSPMEKSEGSDETAPDSSVIEQAKDDIPLPEVPSESPDHSNHVLKKPIPSPDDYYPKPLEHDRLPESLRPFSQMFQHIWPIKTPGDDKYSKMFSPIAAMLSLPIAKTKEEKRAKGPQPPRESKHWTNQRTPITEFLASTSELAEEGYVLHPAHYSGNSTVAAESARREASHTSQADGWLDTPGITNLSDGEVPDENIEQGSITQGRKILTLDCEMCITSPAGTTPPVFSLTRISIINWDGEVVMDEFVKPNQEITDYLTPFSGITREKLEGVTTSLRDIQRKLIDEIITPQTILIGHSLNSDLNALQLTHPYIIDTSIIFPHPRGPPLKSSLKWLAQKYLLREIQRGHGATGHDSVEDARACLDLVKQKCEKGKTWGTSEASNESIFKRLERHIRPKHSKANIIGDDEPRCGALVDWGDPSRGYGTQARVTIACESDSDIVAGVQRALTGDTPGAPQNGVDFVFARLRNLEAYRGWWNKGKVSEAAATATATTEGESTSLSSVLRQTVADIRAIYEALPPCTVFILYSGSGDPRPLGELQNLRQRFRDEYKTLKWDELSVKWTDVEEQRLRAACRDARLGIGFVGVK